MSKIPLIDGIQELNGRGSKASDLVKNIDTNFTEVYGRTDSMTRLPQIVGSRGMFPCYRYGNGVNSRADIRIDARTAFKTGPYDVTQIEVVLSNAIAEGNGVVESDIANDVGIEAALERTSPVKADRFYFGGQANSNMSAGVGARRSDPMGVRLDANTRYMIRTGMSLASNTLNWPAGLQGDYTGDASMLSPSNTTSQTLATGAYANAGTGSLGSVTRLYGPLAVLGIPSKPHPSVIILGDSIPAGVGDTTDTEGNIGYVAKGLSNVAWNGFSSVTIPYVKYTIGGDRASVNQDDVVKKRAGWRFGTHLICTLGSNDLAVLGSNLATAQSNLTTIWKNAKATVGPYGKPLHVTQTLLFPRETGAAGNAATGFTGGANSIAQQLNNWILSQVGQGLLDAAFDPAVGQKDSTNPNLWNPTYRPGDYVHPITIGHELASNIVRTNWAATLKV